MILKGLRMHEVLHPCLTASPIISQV